MAREGLIDDTGYLGFDVEDESKEFLRGWGEGIEDTLTDLLKAFNVRGDRKAFDVALKEWKARFGERKCRITPPSEKEEGTNEQGAQDILITTLNGYEAQTTFYDEFVYEIMNYDLEKKEQKEREGSK